MVIAWLSLEQTWDEDTPYGIWDRDRLDRSIADEVRALTDGRRGRPHKGYDEEKDDDTRNP